MNLEKETLSLRRQQVSEYYTGAPVQPSAKTTIITSVVLGVLALLLASGALTGYLGLAPSWVNPHLFAILSLLPLALAGVIMVVKPFQASGEIPGPLWPLEGSKLKDNTLKGKITEEALDQVFGTKGKIKYKEKLQATVFDISKAQEEIEQIDKSVFHGGLEGGNVFSAIKYQTVEGDKGGILLYRISSVELKIHCYSLNGGKTPALQTSLGYPADVAFLKALVEEGKVGEFELRN